MQLPIYELKIKDDTDGIEYVSIVDYPASERQFIAMSEKIKFRINSEYKRIVTGLILPVDQPVYRCFPELGECYVTISKETVDRIIEKFFLQNNLHHVNINHLRDARDVYMIESYQKDIQRGISPKGFEDVKDGSWFGTYKVLNNEVWQDILNGRLRGFSIEGLLSLDKPETPCISTMEDLIKFLNQLN